MADHHAITGNKNMTGLAYRAGAWPDLMCYAWHTVQGDSI